MTTAIEQAPFRLPRTPDETDLLAKYFRALGHPARLRILATLATHGELTVSEIVGKVGLPQPKVSDHLACLRWCGFVDARRDHRIVNYRLADRRVAEIVGVARELLHENVEHVAACRHVGGAR